MKLMRNVTPNGQCKYAAVRMDKLQALSDDSKEKAVRALLQLSALGLLENPVPGEQEEFFLIKLKDRHSRRALEAYASSALTTDAELASEVMALSKRAGDLSPFCKEPDTDPAAYGVEGNSND